MYAPQTFYQVLNGGNAASFTAVSLAPSVKAGVGAFSRSSKFLEDPVFNTYHDEHSMLRCGAGGARQSVVGPGPQE